MLAVCLVAATSVYTDLTRFANPVGDKYVPYFGPGQNDFSYAYFGARALLADVNPYRNKRPEFTNPIFPIERIKGDDYKQLYPPGYLLTLVPLAHWKGADWQAAARVWFRFNLAALVAIAALTWALARRATQTPLTSLWIPFLAVCLALNPGEELGLERGQGDTLIGLLCWTAVLCFLRGSTGVAIFLAMWGTFIKGYPVVFAAGLGLLALRGGRWRQTLAGGAAAVVVFVLPVLRYLDDAGRAIRYRSDMFLPVWFNHSFRNLVHRFSPANAEKGRLVLSAFALAVALAALVKAWRSSSRETPSAHASWVVLFAIASLGTMIGYSSFSVSYDLILIYPGTLILALSQNRMASALALPGWARHALGAGLLACLWLLFVCRLGDDPPGYDGNIPAAAYGLAGLFVILSALLARGIARRAEA